MFIDVYGFFVQALDTFNAAIVSPVYYVMFTTLTIIASAIMFKVECSTYPVEFFFFFYAATWSSQLPGDNKSK